MVRRHRISSTLEQELIIAGIFLQKYPNVLGTDVAGEVHEVGEGVTHVKKGDRVLGSVCRLPSAASC
jgi:NADPH:quinone reductase-like Zn-dependent oxidoreductase